MLDNLVPIVATGVFTLAGVLLSAVLERWRSREKRLQTLFDKKVEAYSDLVRQAHEISVGDLLKRDEKALTKRGMDFILKLGNYALFASQEVTALAVEFGSAAASSHVDHAEKRKKLGPLHRELRSRCQEELGIADLGPQRVVEKPK